MKKKITSQTQRELARKLNRNHIYINSVLRHRARPSHDLAVAIVAEMHGAVSYEELRPAIHVHPAQTGPMTGERNP